MIRANELTVGDWVLYMGKPHYVIAIETDGIVKITTPELADWCRRATWTDRMEPIPLTPEILEKNGFRYNDEPFVQGWEQFGLTLYRGGNGYRINCGSNVALVIDSAHELQHCLKLVGIDKEITI